jgi:hypothetical protein
VAVDGEPGLTGALPRAPAMLVAPMNATAFGPHFRNFAPAGFDAVARSFALAEVDRLLDAVAQSPAPLPGLGRSDSPPAIVYAREGYS